VFERFGDRARRAVVLAQQEVFQLGHDAIGSEHLLLGQLREPDPLAAATMQSHGMTYHSAVSAIAGVVAPGERDWNTMPPFSPGAVAAIQRCEQVLLDRGDSVVEPEHLLLSVLGQPERAVVALLESFGTDPTMLVAELIGRMNLRS
jgi:ATP-dependent Clp protease ATP-binding subunit ClpC